MAKSGQSSTGRNDPELDDMLEGAPPQPPSMKPRSAADSGGIPRSSDDSMAQASGALSVMGMQPVRQLVAKMASLESLVKDLSTIVPALSTAAAPFIAQMRDLGMAALADMAQGGVGGADLGTGAPPPMMPGSQPPPAAMGGGGAPGGMGPGAGVPMMPPPPPG